MYVVSPEYKEQINKKLRNLSFIRVHLGVLEPDAATSNTMSDTSHSYLSELQETDMGKNVLKKYMTFEHNRFILDGNGVLPPEAGDPVLYYQGYMSEYISGSDGVFVTPPEVIIDFTQNFAFVGLTFRFDKILGTYPSEMVITAYNGAAQVYQSTVTPTSYDFIMEDNIPASGYCNRLSIKFTKTYPYKRRACMEYIMFGIVKTFTDENISTSTWTKNTDLLSTKIPTNSFQFTIFDPTKDYNPDNAEGFWQYIEKKQPVSWEYGYELDDDTIEWITGGHLLTSEDINTDSSKVIPKVTFKATSILNQLTEKYYRGIYPAQPVSLYSLALDVLTFAQLPLLHNGEAPYFVDTALQTIMTSMPIPELNVNEALQLIANAGRAVVDVDRDGRINIVRIAETQLDFSLDFACVANPPRLAKAPNLLSVTSYYNTLVIDSVESSLANSDVTFSSATLCRFTYQAATAQRLVLGAGLNIIGQPVFYATSCVVTLTGSGNVSILGKLLQATKRGVVLSTGEVGYDCPIENVLLNTEVDAQAYVEWVASIIKRRNTYSVENRGYPEMDTLDCIYAETLYSQDLPATVTANTINYNGALSGTTTYVVKEEV